MCFPCFYLIELISLTPLMLLFIMPMFGMIFGVEHVLRLSLVLYFYIVINHYLSKQLGVFGPFLSGLSLMMSFTVQLAVMPGPLLWLYEVLLWLIEPIMEFAEVLMIVSLSMKASCWLMDFDDDHSPLGKVSVIAISMTSFTLASFFLWIVLPTDGEDSSKWLFYGLTGLYIATTLMTFIIDKGIISDAGIVCLASSVALIVYNWERRFWLDTAFQSTASAQSKMNIEEESKTLFDMMASLPQMSLQFTNQPINAFRRIFSLPFWVVMIVRVVSALWLAFQVKTWRSKDEDDSDCAFLDDDTDEEEDRGWGRKMLRFLTYSSHFNKNNPVSLAFTLTNILSAVFVYTQMIVVHLGRGYVSCDNNSENECNSWDATHILQTGNIRLLIQCFGVMGIYWWKLCSSFNDEDDEIWSTYKF